MDTLVFGARYGLNKQLRLQGYNGPLPEFEGSPGFLEPACPEGALHWVWPNTSIPLAGRSLHWIEVAAKSILFLNSSALQNDPGYTEEYVRYRIAHLQELHSYPPKKPPRRPEGEELQFAGPLFNDPNQARGIAPGTPETVGQTETEEKSGTLT